MTTPDSIEPTTDDTLPPGDHPLEVAARSGFGPLSPNGREVWHGNGWPCVSCGQLVQRDSTECEHCGQDLSPAMIERMRTFAGPWYVLEHVRPFPGITLERIVLQIRRGVLTETSIVRGPPTDFQWRFAVETPGLCRFFGKCWKCHAAITPTDPRCHNCSSVVVWEQPTAPVKPPPKPAAAATEPEQPVLEFPDPLQHLSAAVVGGTPAQRTENWDSPPRIVGIRATWVVIGMLFVLVVAVIGVTQWRTRSESPQRPNTPQHIQHTD